MTGTPSAKAQIMYINRNAAPPFACTCAGKRHTVPSPTAEPTVAAIKPILERNNTFSDM
jgi:hypothetical protein